MRTALNRVKKQFSDLYSMSYGCFYLHDIPGFSSVSFQPKKINHSKVVKFTGKMRNELTLMKNQFSDFLVFEI